MKKKDSLPLQATDKEPVKSHDSQHLAIQSFVQSRSGEEASGFLSRNLRHQSAAGFPTRVARWDGRSASSNQAPGPKIDECG